MTLWDCSIVLMRILMYLLLRLIINAAALLLVAYLVPGFEVGGIYAALIVAVILGVLNAIVRPLLIVLTLPINIITLGLFTFIINALILWFVSTFVKGFDITGFIPALAGALILWFVSLVASWLIKQAKK